MKNQRVSTVTRCVETITAIARSSEVAEFVIGLCSHDWRQRAAQYRAEGFRHFIIVAGPMSLKRALATEETLFNACVIQRSFLYGKYHRDKRDGGYRSSAGGLHVESVRPSVIYMTW